ncbi:uncharacterized protein LOC105664638 isoform X1 [Ceratitis capitata]|uniref:uncharacterized protein LOC105664638 isoform X1 n=1 Tax=Ceratitis capitata TaxID=7213 RepID=UPI0006189287|nr:uncharacterized protein LOC105664638 isoform X1 [Ceratitis capitata]
MSAFKKMFNLLRPNKISGSILDVRTMSDKSVPSNYSGNTRPSVYTFRNGYSVACRASTTSTRSEVSHVNYANELNNWRQIEPNTTLPLPSNSIMPGYYGQYGFSDPYPTTMQYQNSSYGYPFLPENQLMPPEAPLFPDNRLMGVDSPLPAMPSITPMPESRGMRPDAFRSGMVTIPLDKLKRMRAAKDLYNILNYLESDEAFLRKSKTSKTKKSSKKIL